MTKIIARIAGWLAPPRTHDFTVAYAGVETAQRRLNDVQKRSAAVHSVVQAHREDRYINHYGERILRALEGQAA